MQDQEIWLGHYDGPLDGKLGPGTSEAINRFLAASGQPQTGVLTDAQQTLMLQRAASLRTASGYSRIRDTSGASMGVPRTLLPIEKTSQNGREFSSPDGSAIFAIRHFNSPSAIQDVYENLRAGLSSTNIIYSVQRPTWFVLSGEKSGCSYYFRFFRTNSGYEGFYAAYDSARSNLFSPIAVLTSLTFQIPAEPSAPSRSTPPVTTLPIEEQLRRILFKNPASNTTVVAQPNLQNRPWPDASPIVRGPDAANQTKNATITPETPDDPEASKVLLDSVEVLISHSAVKGTRVFRYSVDKSLLPTFSDNMPLLRIVFEEKVFFDTDRSDLRPDAMSTLNSVATTLQKSRGRLALFVAGHTDSRGTDEHNLDLSVRRAESVARFLTSNGIGSAAIWRVGFGKSVPIKPNSSDQNMALNRRVEFLLASQPAVVAAWIKDSKGICEEGNAENCGVFRDKNNFVAVQVAGSGPKQIEIDLPPTKPQEIEVNIQPVEVGAPQQ